MSWKRIKTVLLYSWYHLIHSVETWADVIWYPFIQILVFGMIAMYFAAGGEGGSKGEHIILGLLLWQLVAVGQYSVSLGMLWDVWSQSFSTLFITPLKMREFMVGQILVSGAKAVTVFLLGAVLGIWFYKFNIFVLDWWLVLYFINLMMFAWSSGMFILGLIFRFGVTIQSFGWSLIYLVQPLGAVFYPVSVLPAGIRWISYMFPVTYVFEAARRQLDSGVVDINLIIMAVLMNLVYFVLNVLFMKKMFSRARITGEFVRMEQ